MNRRVTADRVTPGRITAKLDFLQSATGVILGTFIWFHLFFDSGIIIGKEAMYKVAKALEGSFLDPEGHGYPILVSIAAASIFVVFVAHAGLALRKFPANWHQFNIFHRHSVELNHEDTRAWSVQVMTGFTLFFLGSMHLLYMMFFPGGIGPHLSAERIYSNGMWLFYLVLLFAVVLHAGIGLYKVCVKWGLFMGKDPRVGRVRLKAFFRILTGIFLVLGVVSIVIYGKIGHENRDQKGVRYVPLHLQHVQSEAIHEAQASTEDETKMETHMNKGAH
ncbi:MAG: fumarate reductase cytochrome b subunit [SAR324 cluster bacterium]|nr:fumarate reductase cytochrome b subunit [SAR324 cluster bacterium]